MNQQFANLAILVAMVLVGLGVIAYCCDRKLKRDEEYDDYE